jgi:hypothetical protein
MAIRFHIPPVAGDGVVKAYQCWSGSPQSGAAGPTWQSLGNLRGATGGNRATPAERRTPPDLLERDLTTSDEPVKIAYGSEGWGFESPERGGSPQVRPLSGAIGGGEGTNRGTNGLVATACRGGQSAPRDA